MKPYYEAEGVTIYHGDCREILPTLTDAGVDLVLTDPPYNYGFAYGKHDDAQTPEQYEAWCKEWFDLAFAVCRRMVVFPGNGNLHQWWHIRKPSAVGCWHKPGNFASSHIGWDEWEPWFYWGTRVGGSSVVRSPLQIDPAANGHPCPKPLRLMELLIQKFKAQVVLDPFLGSGTSAVAARLLGRTAIGIEVEERFCEIAVKRLAQGLLDFEEAG